MNPSQSLPTFYIMTSSEYRDNGLSGLMGGTLYILSFPLLRGVAYMLSVSILGVVAFMLSVFNNIFICLKSWTLNFLPNTSGGVALAIYLFKPSWFLSLLSCKVIDIMSNGVLIPITNLDSIAVSVSASNAYSGSSITL